MAVARFILDLEIARASWGARVRSFERVPGRIWIKSDAGRNPDETSDSIERGPRTHEWGFGISKSWTYDSRNNTATTLDVMLQLLQEGLPVRQLLHLLQQSLS